MEVWARYAGACRRLRWVYVAKGRNSLPQDPEKRQRQCNSESINSKGNFAWTVGQMPYFNGDRSIPRLGRRIMRCRETRREQRGQLPPSITKKFTPRRCFSTWVNNHLSRSSSIPTAREARAVSGVDSPGPYIPSLYASQNSHSDPDPAIDKDNVHTVATT